MVAPQILAYISTLRRRPCARAGLAILLLLLIVLRIYLEYRIQYALPIRAGTLQESSVDIAFGWAGTAYRATLMFSDFGGLVAGAVGAILVGRELEWGVTARFTLLPQGRRLVLRSWLLGLVSICGVWALVLSLVSLGSALVFVGAGIVNGIGAGREVLLAILVTFIVCTSWMLLGAACAVSMKSTSVGVAVATGAPLLLHFISIPYMQSGVASRVLPFVLPTWLSASASAMAAPAGSRLVPRPAGEGSEFVSLVILLVLAIVSAVVVRLRLGSRLSHPQG